jgi:hypothetical protein
VGRAELLVGLALFADLPPLCALVHHAAWLLRSGADLPGPDRWPMIDRAIHPAGPLFWAYAVLANVDHAIGANRARGIDEAVTVATLRDLGRWLDDHRRARGHPGFAEVGWLRLHVQGRLFEIGRLQYAADPWRAPVRMLRHRADRWAVLVMAGGQRLRADGRFQGACGSAEDPAGFTTALIDSAAGWQAHAVDARGRAASTPTHFPRADWDLVLAHDDPVWSLHIPAGSPLTIAACRDSLVRARDLLPRWFPGHGARAFASVSWLFDAQLADYLPAGTNLVHFQRAFHLHPVDDRDGTQIRERVLGNAPIAALVPTTSLQGAVIGHLRDGGIWCQAGAVLMDDEVDG